jgi:hypothetical protein
MKPFIIVLILSQGIDMSTSLAGFRRGAGESNPFVVSTQPAPFIIEGAAFTAVESLLLVKLSKNHPKWAKGLAMVQIGGSAAASVNNEIVFRQVTSPGSTVIVH